ncbi:MAG: ATP-dependent DNA helicase [Patescibacteria group bacterium]
MADFNKVFKERYGRLNPSQKEAVDSIEGPVMVVAGPGTGKTSVLVMRIASILANTDTSPENILALTFTESGVTSMRKALSGIIGADANKVKIFTFHSFCNTLISDFPEEFPEIVGARHIPESEQISVIESILSNNSFEYLTPLGNPFYYVRELLSAISALKREGFSPEAFYRAIEGEEATFYQRDDLYNNKGKYKGQMKGDHLKTKKYIEKNKELGYVFENYQNTLRDSLCYDYEDMILESVKRLENNKDLSLLVQEENHYILADEHQDANSAQNRVIKELTSFHDNPNIFIVGDEKQAIFRFQGASLDNFMYFKDLYPGIKTIYLTDNYRSQKNILDASHVLIESGTSFVKGVHKKLKAVIQKEERPLVLSMKENSSEEAFAITKSVEELLEKGVPPSEIAVIYRDHKDAKSLVKAFERTSIPFVARSDKDLLKDPFIQRFIILMEAVSDPIDDDKLFRALHLSFLGVNTTDVFRANQKARSKGVTLHEFLDKGAKELGLADEDPLFSAFGKIKYWSELSFNSDLMSVLESMLYRSGAMEEALTDNKNAMIVHKLRSFFKQADKFNEEFRRADLKEFVKHISTMGSYGLSFKSAGEEFPNRVELMTAHASKGREFDHVFIINAVNGKWGNRRNRSLFKLPGELSGSFGGGDNEDERRLFYVALTRARSNVFISYPRIGDNDREQLPSSFIEDIDKEGFLNKKEDSKDLEDKKSELFIKEFQPVTSKGPSLEDREYIAKVFMEQPLSVTALNAYLACPWRYFYVNLMRIPSVYSLSQRFGIAAHESLREFFEHYRDKEDPGKDFLINSFTDAVSRQSITQADAEAIKEKGVPVLGGYYDNYAGTWRRDIVTEKAINDVEMELDVLPAPLRLTGKLDKIEGENEVTVIDYKTGKPKSRNHIEGKTKDSDGAIKRQLVFYKLLTELSPSFKGSMSEGVIDFVEPDQSGKYKREAFFVNDDEVAELKDIIKRMTEEVLSASFWDKGCEEPECPYCEIRKKVSPHSL